MILPPLRSRLAASRMPLNTPLRSMATVPSNKCVTGVLECRQRHDPSVVDQDIDAAECGLGLVE